MGRFRNNFGYNTDGNSSRKKHNTFTMLSRARLDHAGQRVYEDYRNHNTAQLLTLPAIDAFEVTPRVAALAVPEVVWATADVEGFETPKRLLHSSDDMEVFGGAFPVLG